MQRMDLLAAKLGVTVEHLWGVLIRQAYVEAVRDVFVLGVFVVAEVLIYRYLRGRIMRDFFDTPLDLLAVIAAFVVGIGLLIMAIEAPSSIAALANPEYFALQYVRDALGSVAR